MEPGGSVRSEESEARQFNGLNKIMNKVTLTRKGMQCLQQDNEEERPSPVTSPSLLTKRSSSLPQLISTAQLLEKQEVSDQLGRLTLRLKDLQGKGLRRIMIEKEDSHLARVMREEMADRKDYIRNIVPMLVRKTRDDHRFGNLQSRIERGRAYVNRLEHNF